MKEDYQKVLKKVPLFFLSNPVLFNSLSANPTKWSNTLKQFVDKLPMNCLSVFDHFVKLAIKGLMDKIIKKKRGLELVTSHSSDYKINLENSFISYILSDQV